MMSDSTNPSPSPPRKKLPVLCPQLYQGTRMLVTICNRCNNWNEATSRCDVEMGLEHLELETQIPDCPMSHRCQHQLQEGDSPCKVRARGMLCESVVGMDHPLAFNAIMIE